MIQCEKSFFKNDILYFVPKQDLYFFRIPLNTMNTFDERALSRATIRLLLDNQKISEKVGKVKLEAKNNKEQAEKWRDLWAKERENAEKLRIDGKKIVDMAVSLFKKYDLQCACEDTENCENDLCQTIYHKKIMESSVSSESSSSDSD